MRTHTALVVATVAALLAGTALAAPKEENKVPDEVKAILDKADSFELYSLDPNFLKDVKDGFHGFKVLGKTEVKEADTRKALVAATVKGAAENKGEVARCFEPRHGIRLTRDKKTVDLVICFHCAQVRVYAHGAEKATGEFLTTNSPQPTFDMVLRDAKVPLPKAADE